MDGIGIHERLKIFCQKWFAGSTPAPRTIREEPAMQISKLRRAVGICRNLGCEDYNKDVFLVNHGDFFTCPKCNLEGRYKLEIGSTDNKTSLDFYQVRVEFCYDPDLDGFRSVAIVTDETMTKEGGNVYTLKSPLIRTDKRALQVAEALLGNLMLATDEVFDGSGLGRAKEHLLCFDVPFEDVKRDLDKLAFELENSRLRRK